LKHLILVIAFFALITGCGKKETDAPPVDRKKFTAAYEKYLEYVTADTAKTELFPAYLDSALKQNDMTHKEFEQSVEYYKEHPEEFTKVLTDVNNYLNKLARAKKKVKPEKETKSSE